MKKAIIISVISTAGMVLPLGGYASGLVPEQCTIGDRPVFAPIADISFDFGGAVGVVSNSTVSIYCGEEPVATGTMSAVNYVGDKQTQGRAVITFERPLVLPKGKTYKVVVPEGAVFKEDAPAVSNDELVVGFEIPATLGEATPSIENGAIVAEADMLGFFFRTETAALGVGEFTLLREDVPVRTYPCTVSWDWDLGYAGVEFGEPMKFEAGVRYALQMPQGIVCALHRSDITNDEAAVCFVGGYEEPMERLDYVWCSLYDEHPSDVLGEVRFYYDRPVMLSAEPVVQLYAENEAEVVKEVVPVLANEGEKWILTADFEETPLIPEKGYSVVIPAGTLITAEGDVVGNARNEMPFGDSSGISGTDAARTKITVENGLLRIDRVDIGTEIRLFSLSGAMVGCLTALSETVSMPIRASGMYILVVDGDAYKVAAE